MSQDDGTYADQAIQMSKGFFTIHPANIAYVLPQTLLGASFVKLFSSINPLSVLNTLTWVLFLLVMLLMQSWSRVETRLLLSAFSFPLWVQYGASFLYDMYAIFILVSIIFLTEYEGRKYRIIPLLVLFLLSSLLVLQLQSLCLFPVVLGAVIRGKRGISLILGTLIGVFIYQLLPQGLFQKAVFDHLANKPLHLPSFISNVFQLLLGLGLFLLPLSRLPKSLDRTITFASIAGFFSAWSVLFFTETHLLSVGVFFTDYFPRWFTCALLSVGLVGWLGIFDLLRELWRTEGRFHTRSTILILCIFGFVIPYSIKGIADIRYTMVLFPLVLWAIRLPLKTQNRIGGSLWFLSPMMFLTLILNAYNLDTTSSRWAAAKHLVDQGITRDLISAGYGGDVYSLESDCVKSALRKVSEKDLSSYLFRERIFKQIPRTYMDEWVPRFVIKPYKIFGKTKRLKANRVAGQDEALEALISYRSLGIEHQLAVFRNQSPRLAWCFRSQP